MKVPLKVSPHYSGGFYFEIYTTEKENGTGESTKYNVLCSDSDLFETKDEAIRMGLKAIEEDGDTLVGYYTRFQKG